MRLDKGNILKPTRGLYLIPVKNYSKNVHCPHMMSLFDLKWPFQGSHMQSCTEVINSVLLSMVLNDFIRSDKYLGAEAFEFSPIDL